MKFINCKGLLCKYLYLILFLCNIPDQSLAPHIYKIEEIEQAVLKLEKMAYAIDAYSKRLEAKAKYLSKRWFGEFFYMVLMSKFV